MDCFSHSAWFDSCFFSKRYWAKFVANTTFPCFKKQVV